MNPYLDHGFKNREDYLASLADDYGLTLSHVRNIADTLGANEDFDMLVTLLEENFL